MITSGQEKVKYSPEIWWYKIKNIGKDKFVLRWDILNCND